MNASYMQREAIHMSHLLQIRSVSQWLVSGKRSFFLGILSGRMETVLTVKIWLKCPIMSLFRAADCQIPFVWNCSNWVLRINFNSQPDTISKCHFKCSGKPHSHQFTNNWFVQTHQPCDIIIFSPFLSVVLFICFHGKDLAHKEYFTMEENFMGSVATLRERSFS